jgi:hypothetical protein
MSRKRYSPERIIGIGVVVESDYFIAQCFTFFR